MSNNRSEPLKILLVAEHASALFGGEALIPFQYFKHFREMHVDVHLLVHERTRAELSDVFSEDIERLHFVADSRINIWCDKIGKYLPDRLAVFTLGVMSHLDTQVRQRRMARVLVAQHHFNLVHEPIPVSPKQPSMMFGLSVPVIIGPMNGGMDYPPNYDVTGRFERAIVALLRGTSVFWNAVVPGKKNAALLLVANKRTYDALPLTIRHNNVVEFVENGVDSDRFRPDADRKPHENVNVIYVGRLVDWKRVDLLLEACGKLIGKVNFWLHIVGDGPLRAALDKQVRQLSLTSRVKFHGWLSHAAAAKLMASADVMVLPSMRECGGAVVLEAMASGLPVIATKWGGPVDYITDDTGVLVPPATPKEFVTELANAIMFMARNQQVRVKMGQSARLRAQTVFDWRIKAKALLKIYDDVVSSRLHRVRGEGQ